MWPFKKRRPNPKKRFDIVIQHTDGTVECFPCAMHVSYTKERLSFQDKDGKIHIRSNRNSDYEEIRIHAI